MTCGGRSWAGPERGSEILCVLTHGMGSTPPPPHLWPQFFWECRRYFKLLLEKKLRNAKDGSVQHIAISIGEALKVLKPAINNKGIVRETVLSVTTAHGNVNLMTWSMHYLSCLIEASIVFKIST